MISEKDKVNRIIKEFLTYFMGHQLTDISLHLKVDDNEMALAFTVPCEAEPADFKMLLKELNVPREYELEEYYNGLLGAHHGSQHNYTLLGKALDEAKGTYVQGKLYLWVKRYNLA